MADPRFLAEHIRLALLDAGLDPGIPTVERTGLAYVITYPNGDTTEWAAADEQLARAVEDDLRAAYELALILAHQQNL